MRYILTSEEWGAAEEYRLGLVQELTPPGKQLDRAPEFGDTLSTNALLSVRAALASARQAISLEDPALVALLPAFVQILQSEDAKEARRAVQEHPRDGKTAAAGNPEEGHANDQPSRESGSCVRYCGP